MTQGEKDSKKKIDYGKVETPVRSGILWTAKTFSYLIDNQ